MKKKACNLPVRKTQCATCPFRVGSPYKHLAQKHLAQPLAESAIKEASRICHPTGSNNGINQRTGKPPAICRGARDIQLNVFYALGAIEHPTEEAWNKARAKIGMKPQKIV